MFSVGVSVTFHCEATVHHIHMLVTLRDCTVLSIWKKILFIHFVQINILAAYACLSYDRSRWIAQAKEMEAAFPLPTYVGVKLRLVKIRNSEVISL